MNTSHAKSPLAVLWDFGGVILSSPFDAFNRYEAEAGLPKDFLRGLNSRNPDANAWAKMERSEVSLAGFVELFEAEARQVADWAAAEQPGGRALVLTGPATWQQRLSGAFTARWSQLGLNNSVVDLPSSDGYVDGNALAELRARMQIDPPQLIFAALDAVQLRQVRSAIGTSLPTYGTASVNPGRDPATQAPELAGLRILRLPWPVQHEHPVVANSPSWGTRR